MKKLFLWFFLAACCAAAVAARAQPVLNVYTYDSFASDWGPGPRIKTAFEAVCECELNFVAVDGSAGILSRVRFEGASSRADVVLGLDTSLMAEAKRGGLLAPNAAPRDALGLPVKWNDPVFLPFDYGYFAFIYDREKLPSPPASFRELVAADESPNISMQDTSSAAVGLGLMLGVDALYGGGAAEVWKKIAGKITAVTGGWSQAYGMVLDGEAAMVPR